MKKFRLYFFFFFQAEDGIRDHCVTGVQTCALPIWARWPGGSPSARWRWRPSTPPGPTAWPSASSTRRPWPSWWPRGAVRTIDGRAEVVEMTLPPNLRLTTLRRLSFLPEQTLEALRPASILGSSFSLAELSATTGRSVLELSSELAEAIRAKVLEDDGERLRFRHDLIHEAIYEDLPASVRLALHREAGRRLAEAEATCRMLLDRERDPSVAAQARILLSRTLATQGRIREALQELERVQQSPGLAGKPRAAAWAAESMARVDLGDLDGAEAAAERARTTAAGLGDHPAVILALASLAIVEELPANLARALELIDEAVRLADRSDQRHGHRNPIHLVRGCILMDLDRLPEARSTLQTGRRISEELGVRWRLPLLPGGARDGAVPGRRMGRRPGRPGGGPDAHRGDRRALQPGAQPRRQSPDRAAPGRAAAGRGVRGHGRVRAGRDRPPLPQPLGELGPSPGPGSPGGDRAGVRHPGGLLGPVRRLRPGGRAPSVRGRPGPAGPGRRRPRPGQAGRGRRRRRRSPQRRSLHRRGRPPLLGPDHRQPRSPALGGRRLRRQWPPPGAGPGHRRHRHRPGPPRPAGRRHPPAAAAPGRLRAPRRRPPPRPGPAAAGGWRRPPGRGGPGRCRCLRWPGPAPGAAAGGVGVDRRPQDFGVVGGQALAAAGGPGDGGNVVAGCDVGDGGRDLLGPASVAGGQGQPDQVGPEHWELDRQAEGGALVPAVRQGGERLLGLPLGFQDQGSGPARPVAAEAGAGRGQLALGRGHGRLGLPQLAPVQRDQGFDGVAEHQAVALAGLLG